MEAYDQVLQALQQSTASMAITPPLETMTALVDAMPPPLDMVNALVDVIVPVRMSFIRSSNHV